MTFNLLFIVIIIITGFYLIFFTSLNKSPVNSISINERFMKKDTVILAFICIIYGFVAFFRSGSDVAPENYVHFNSGDEVIFSVNDSSAVKSVKAYTGLNTGRYVFKAFDEEAGCFIQVGELNQEYSKLFQWNTLYISAESLDNYSIFSLTALSDLYLNELVILDEYSSPLEPSLTDSSMNAAGLFDEQYTYCENTFYSGTYFDEIYHARTAFEHITGIKPYEITHPPLGKIIISLGIRLFGMNPFGWRFSGILFGILMLIPFYILLSKLFSCTLVSGCGTVLFAFDFMHFTQTRISTIDTYAVFFIILMYLFMYLYVSSRHRRYLWLGLCGVTFGIGCACKWTCMYAGCGLAIIWLYDYTGLVEDALSDRSGIGKCVANIFFCICFFIIVPATIYYLSYIPYGEADGLQGFGMLFNKKYLNIFTENQVYMFNYHANIVAEHPYSSRWYEWIFDVFPMLYYLDYLPDDKKSVISCFVNPLICWSGLISICYMPIRAFFDKDRKAAFIFIGFISQLLPWIFIKRLTFEYHYFPSTVFLIISICEIFSILVKQEKRARLYIIGFTTSALLLFALFYPVLSGYPISQSYSGIFLQWLPKWYL